jgi:hypothetical protein
VYLIATDAMGQQQQQLFFNCSSGLYVQLPATLSNPACQRAANASFGSVVGVCPNVVAVQPGTYEPLENDIVTLYFGVAVVLGREDGQSATSYIDTTNSRFAWSTSLPLNMTRTRKSARFGSFFVCPDMPGCSGGFANVDLSGTALTVNDTFKGSGWRPCGTLNGADVTKNSSFLGKQLSLEGWGYCGIFGSLSFTEDQTSTAPYANTIKLGGLLGVPPGFFSNFSAATGVTLCSP